MFKEIFQERPSEEGDLIPHNEKPAGLPPKVLDGGQIGSDDGAREAMLEEMIFGEDSSKTNPNSEK